VSAKAVPEITGGSGGGVVKRDVGGRFIPGSTLNPKGRPKDVHGIGELARSHAPEAIERLVVLARGRGSAAVAACKELLDRGLGKAPQAIDATIRRGGPDAIGGQPDAARQRLEALILEAQAGTTDKQPVALPEKTELLPTLGEIDAVGVAKSWPDVPPGDAA
jgi:hypothetical protein